MTRPLVLGIDSSTQSCKALLVDSETGEVVDSRRAPHPEGTEVDPRAWVDALNSTVEELLPRAEAVAVGGQQHGMVLLDEQDAVVRPALLWNDTRSAAQAESLTEFLGGPEQAVRRIGALPVASFTATKIRWTRENEPENISRAARVALPHDYLTMTLHSEGELWTDRSEASGTAYFDAAADAWLPEVLEWAAGSSLGTPRLAGVHEVIGRTRSGAVIAPGAGDNAAAALGLGMGPGDVCISLGTSAVVSTVAAEPLHDPSGRTTGFADAAGGFLHMSTTLNGAGTLDWAARMLGVDHRELSDLADRAPSGAGGAVFIPYLRGERTPNLPEARGQLLDIGGDFGRPEFARAVLEGLACSLREGLETLLEHTKVEPQRILLVGGGAASEAFRGILSAVLGRPVVVPESREFVALGAARQAAWTLKGQENPPEWQDALGQTSTYEEPADEDVYARYLEQRNQLYPGC